MYNKQMDRLKLTDTQWKKIEPLCLGKATDRGRTGKNNRLGTRQPNKVKTRQLNFLGSKPFKQDFIDILLSMVKTKLSFFKMNFK